MTIRQESKCSINVSEQLSCDKVTIVSFRRQAEVVAPGSKTIAMNNLPKVVMQLCPE